MILLWLCSRGTLVAVSVLAGSLLTCKYLFDSCTTAPVLIVM